MVALTRKLARFSCRIALPVAVLTLATTEARAALIAGRVVDDRAQPLASIHVLLVDTSRESNCCRDAETQTSVDGSFTFNAPPGVYVVRTYVTPTPWYPVAVRVDTRSGDRLGLQLQLRREPRRYVPDDPPRASRISFSDPTADGEITVRGAAGAVPGNAFVILVTTETGHLAFAEAAADGSFVAQTFGPPGVHILVEADPYGDTIRAAGKPVAMRTFPPEESFFFLSPLAPLVGTVIEVPVPSAGDGRIAFGGAGSPTYSNSALPPWIVSGTINKNRFNAGERLEITASVRVNSPLLATIKKISASPALSLERMSLENGEPLIARATQASSFLTPTGFAIENNLQGLAPGQVMKLDIPVTGSQHAEATFTMRVQLPQNLASGYYRPFLQFFFSDYPVEQPPSRPITIIDDEKRNPADGMYLPIIRVGGPAAPHLFWTLLTGTLSSATYGAAAKEDERCCAIAPTIQQSSKLFVIPRVDERTQTPIIYRLEPFAPMIQAGDRGVPPSAPSVPFRFPSGRLAVRIERPDGVIQMIGPAPFVQSRLAGPIDRHGRPFDGGGRNIHNVSQLTTLDPRFEVAFDLEGPHRIVLDGEIEDIYGVLWRGHGTFDIHVGPMLVLDTASLPGTPYEVGDILTPEVTIEPPIAADVEFRIQQFEDTAKILDRTIRTRANRFGHVSSVEGIRFDRPGEYRVDVNASYRDATGRWLAGSRTWGGIVAARDTPIIGHGRRGIDVDPIRQWFFRTQTTAPPIPNNHVHFPFASGDVVWGQESDALMPRITIDDREGSIANLIRQRWHSTTFNERASLGELPLFISRADSFDPHLDPASVDMWAYSYRSVQRPAVRIREQIASWEEFLPSMYWRFSDEYGQQAGVGRSGDRPNDFKFQFGGAVVRGTAVGKPSYGIYGSLFVLVPNDDPGGGTRIFPPFQGNGGGPSGGPLFTLKGKPIDLFFHPTAVRPGTILQIGESASFAGYSAPTLPSKIEVIVTSPSGLTRTIRGQADKIGYFYDPGQDFGVFEAGVWKAKVRINFDGITSAGQVTAPFPAGDVLGSRDGEFYFYVVGSDSPQLELGKPPQFVRPAEGPITFRITPPAGLTNIEMTYTTLMPGFILDEGKTTTLTYTYDAPKLARDFPNLDLFDADGFAGVDTITMSFLVSGTDASGARKHFARQIFLQGEELQMPDQKAPPSRRRP
ncbi:MAG TPA: carboxypeptidase-like regulatory domain-containing protein [Acidobacteriota bacterium]